MSLDVHFSSGKDDWQTPDKLFHEWNRRYDFTVDGAANEHNHLCPRWYGFGGERINPIKDKWNPLERYWLNPPYSRGLQESFVKKAYEVAIEGGLVVLLLPARTDTKLFHKYIWNKQRCEPHAWVKEFHLLEGRIRFKGAAASAPFPSMIVVFGKNYYSLEMR